MCCCCCECMSDIFLVVLSVLFPPLPVWIRRGICSADSFINILLCILGYLPGLIHSWYIIAKYPPYTLNQESRVYYVYQNSSDLESQRTPARHSVSVEPAPVSTPNYASTDNRAEREPLLINDAPPAYTELPTSK
ncbi:hypothetical protein CLUG_05301 [Clavispora lusitaniae ATCC 42720]|uniref:Plasma membrane proteolipid protein n=1 Tax=Clavispora lusitaniae (strain ATCC 42720) TaxID=306902 RepID=C4YAS3_CLAL4|nr:uncharacterized protein CLUG_05301 [Clavispora lusitaniae ATCC 42720]EEQ41173.1 hypothetical protein CLUG_05301 [Clavispora lusitaniae ATCC 42720]